MNGQRKLATMDKLEALEETTLVDFVSGAIEA